MALNPSPIAASPVVTAPAMPPPIRPPSKPPFNPSDNSLPIFIFLSPNPVSSLSTVSSALSSFFASPVASFNSFDTLLTPAVSIFVLILTSPIAFFIVAPAAFACSATFAKSPVTATVTGLFVSCPLNVFDRFSASVFACVVSISALISTVGCMSRNALVIAVPAVFAASDACRKEASSLLTFKSISALIVAIIFARYYIAFCPRLRTNDKEALCRNIGLC